METKGFIRIHEVAPRDGLQDEKKWVQTRRKLHFIAQLAAAGARSIEVTAFVNKKKIPQMADATNLIKKLKPVRGVEYHVLVPNMRGLENALKAGIKSAGVSTIAVFTSATETFAEKNIGMSIEQSLREFADMAKTAESEGLKMRGYISTCFFDPFLKRKVKPKNVRKVADRLFEIGCGEICLADTTGDATPKDVRRLLKQFDPLNIALHFHDKNKIAVSNVKESMEFGFSAFDSSAGGLGGCPTAPNAPGNIATEELVTVLGNMGFATGIDPKKLSEAMFFIKQYL